MNEQKQAGANYIINFYNEVEALNTAYSQFINLLAEIKHRHGKEPEELEEDEITAIKNFAQQVRHYLHLCYIRYVSIWNATELELDKDLILNYKNLVESFIFKEEDLEKFVLSINSNLINNVMEDLLKTSRDVIKEVYG